MADAAWPGGPGEPGAPLQRPVGGSLEDSSAPEAWRVEADKLAGDVLTDAVDRLTGDLDVLTDLALVKFQGELWDRFADALARYGYAVIWNWTVRNLIFERCKTKGFGGLPQLERPITDEEAQELANETVAKALRHFRSDVLMKHKWDHRKGASLRTYFIGQCIIRFPNIYRTWHGAELRKEFALIDDLNLDDRGIDPPDSRVIAGILGSEAMATIKDPRVRMAMHMTAEGFPQTAIAEQLGISVKAVERMLANERARLRKRGVG
ncbi:RNA polymerase sigma factor [Nocardioides sp. NPDC059952]|uniref:RNA polymerase sigma factor n=2 Tax=Actinomycetes TaxID=1760 RepID=UPI0036676440